MLVKTYGAAVNGIDAIAVTIEVLAQRGSLFNIVGLPDKAVKESAQRVQSAIVQSGLQFPRHNIVINMAPADVRKEGAAYDLPIAVGMLAAAGTVKADRMNEFMIMGELSLDGSVLPIRGVLPMAILARQMGIRGMIVPAANVCEAAVVDKLDVYGVENLRQVADFFNEASVLLPTKIDTRAEFARASGQFDYDFSDVKGQEVVKRALEVACAGGHNVLMVGAPGSGKSMIAKRLPSILPPLTLAEALETTKIHSVAGNLGRGAMLMTARPFRAPHHSISAAALVGGGANPMPGEISLAHNGVLFLDEFAEFPRQVLEVLRQPLEDRHICVSRVKYTVDYPAGFMLVASMNPCPCGNYNHPSRPCVCPPGAVSRYLNRISGPLLDRIDIQVEIMPVPFDKLSGMSGGETSAQIRRRVVEARAIQSARFAKESGIYCNAQMNSRLMREHCRLDSDCELILRETMTRYNMSARAYDRILKVARTIADLDASPSITSEHMLEAVSYRNLDRASWGAVAGVKLPFSR